MLGIYAGLCIYARLVFFVGLLTVGVGLSLIPLPALDSSPPTGLPYPASIPQYDKRFLVLLQFYIQSLFDFLWEIYPSVKRRS